MAEYQNIFTSVQAVGPIHHGIGLPHGNDQRTGEEPAIVHLLGRIGNAQIGSCANSSGWVWNRHRRKTAWRFLEP